MGDAEALRHLALASLRRKAAEDEELEEGEVRQRVQRGALNGSSVATQAEAVSLTDASCLANSSRRTRWVSLLP